MTTNLRHGGRDVSPPRLGRNDGAVLDALRATSAHPTAAAIEDAVRRTHPRIGRATVYRALARLEAAGLILEVGRDALGCHYDARTERHDHAICVACGRVLDLPASARMAEILPAQALAALIEAARAAGLAAVTYEVRLYGRCIACGGTPS